MPIMLELRSIYGSVRHLACAMIFIAQIGSASAIDAVWQPLARMPIESLPVAPVSIVVNRITYDAGPNSSRQSWPGLSVVCVESGSLEIGATGTLTVRRGTPDTPGQSEMIAPGTVARVDAGDSILIAQHADTTIRNTRAEPANVLVAEVAQADQNGTMPFGPDRVEGMSTTRLAFGLARLVPSDRAVIEVGRLTLGSGARVSSESSPGVAGDRAGPEVTVIESGTLGAKVGTGEVKLVRKGLQTDGRGEIVPHQTENTLRPGDAMFGQTGSLDVLWNPAKIPATAMVIRLLPAKVQP
jgi:hypothetical protein